MSKTFLVHGPPGTGKTTYLARQAQLAAEEHDPTAVVIASLTRTAAAEIAGRDTGIPDDQVGTLHAHAYRALDRPELAETPEGLAAFTAAHPALHLTGGRTRLEDAPIDPDQTAAKTRADELHAAVSNHRNRRRPRDQWSDDEREYAALWDDWKQQTGRLDFTDLIERAIGEVPDHPAAPEALLLDEAQDFSALELELARRWARSSTTAVIVGDTDQALYHWRGSDPDALLSLEVAGTRVLQQSYRVPKVVHDLAHRWISQIAGRAQIDYEPTGETGEVRALPVSLARPDPLVDQIAQDLDDGLTAMVLTTCGYMLAPVLHALRDAGIPFHNPHRVTQGAWNPLRAGGRLAAFLRPREDIWGGAARAWTWRDLRTWTEPLQAAGTLARGAKALIEEKCRADQFGDSQADREVPLEQLLELLDTGTYATLHHPAIRLDVDWWAGRLRATKAKQMAYPLQVLKAQGPAALREQPRVTVGTIHSVKGGEADSVYLFPDLSKQGMWQGWRPGGPGRDQIIRMIYVALTRARRRVTVLDPSGPEHVPLDLLAPGLEAAA